jgi:hypothetical protein
MRIYWTLKSIPELSNLPLRERWRVWRAAWRMAKPRYHWLWWVGLAAVAVCIVVGRFIGSQINQSGMLTIGTLVGAGLGGFISGQITTALVRPYILDVLGPAK